MTVTGTIDTDMEGITPYMDRVTRQQRVNGAGELIWRVRVYDQNVSKQVERTAYGLEDALRLRADLKANAGKPAFEHKIVVSASTVTVREWAARWLVDYAVKNDGRPRPATSLNNAKQRLEIYVLPQMGDRTMASIALSELEDHVKHLQRVNGSPASGHTKESVAATIRTMWKAAHKRGVLTHDPAAQISAHWGGAANSTRRLIKPSLSDVYLLAEAMGEGLRDVVLLLAYTGIRWAEASGLYLYDINWPARTITLERAAPVVNGKRVPPVMDMTMKTHNARRVVPIVDLLEEPLQRLERRAEKVLLKARAEGKEPEAVLVVGERDRGPLHYRTWRNALKQAHAATGVTYTAHELRHVFASILIDSGLRDEQIAYYMGHSSAAFTRRIYGHWFPKDHRPDAELLSAAMTNIQQRERDALAPVVALSGSQAS